MPSTETAPCRNRELRIDTHLAAEVNAALFIAAVEGIGGAIEYMRRHAIDHQVAMRVLASPHLHRKHICDCAGVPTH